MDNFNLNEALKSSAQEAIDIARGKCKATQHKIIVSSGPDVKKYVKH